jgi:hypothetical protein
MNGRLRRVWSNWTAPWNINTETDLGDVPHWALAAAREELGARMDFEKVRAVMREAGYTLRPLPGAGGAVR